MLRSSGEYSVLCDSLLFHLTDTKVIWHLATMLWVYYFLWNFDPSVITQVVLTPCHASVYSIYAPYLVNISVEADIQAGFILFKSIHINISYISAYSIAVFKHNNFYNNCMHRICSTTVFIQHISEHYINLYSNTEYRTREMKSETFNQ